jgi:hypothetical protein
MTLPDTIENDESLARFVFARNHLRADGTLRPDAFIPHPYPDLSVQRHLGLSDSDLWRVGEEVGKPSKRMLLGRADLNAGEYRAHNLVVQADPVTAPLPGNPGHALVLRWPIEKSAQKSLAQNFLTKTRYLPAPIT